MVGIDQDLPSFVLDGFKQELDRSVGSGRRLPQNFANGSTAGAQIHRRGSDRRVRWCKNSFRLLH